MQIRKFGLMFLFMAVFYSIAIALWQLSGGIFYLFNFAYIGTAIALGMGLFPILPKNRKQNARRISQVLIGGYMFFGLGFGLIYTMFGFIQPENMQIEGFWFWLLSGAFAASVLHYTIAKIIGPFLINRAWCGWACWTAAVLDLLPFKRSPGRVKYGYIRYIHFALSLFTVLALSFFFGYTLKSTGGAVNLGGAEKISIPLYQSMWQIPELWSIPLYQSMWQIPELCWFTAGNALYFASGILLAYYLKDNRAFCKYLCPITAFLKIGSRASLLKIKGDKNKCIECKACEKNCPMDIKIAEYICEEKRVTSSECIICQSCVNACPQEALKLSIGLDAALKENLRDKAELQKHKYGES